MNFITWIVTSSKDPAALALTVRGLLLGVAPLLVAIAPLIGLDAQFANQTVTDIVNVTEQLVKQVGGLIAIGVVAYGLLRKIVLTIKDRNAKQ